MRHELVWTSPLYDAPEQICACGEDPCPALQFKWDWECLRWSLRGMREDFIPMLRTRWAARGDGEQA